MSLHAFRTFLLVFFLFFYFSCSKGPQESPDPVRVLILSGKNNHDWKGTTMVISGLFRKCNRFMVDITEKPDTLRSVDLLKFDVLVNNWNSWPDTELRWPEELEEDLLDYINSGGGMVFFHASTSSFYEWPEFSEISAAAWEEDTWHTRPCPVKLSFTDTEHPITRGMRDFRIFDELWINAGGSEGFDVLGTASAVPDYKVNLDDRSTEQVGEVPPPQPAVFVKEFGEGRIFHTILGHEQRTVRNTGFRSLLLRGTEWAATGEVSIPLPQELRAKHQSTFEEDAGEFAWFETDSTFGLMEGKKICWQFNHGTIYGKPFFHPVYLAGERITCLGPDDHPWHLGQWFSWKFIDALNYWEFDRTSFQLEGMTDVTDIRIFKSPDYSARIEMDISYHPPGSDPVLTEKRQVSVSSPASDRFIFDYVMTLSPTGEQVLLDRTPIAGEPGGKIWGGYAGISIRFNQDFTRAFWIADTREEIRESEITDSGKVSLENGMGGNWLYMGFDGLHGEKTGSAIFIHPDSRRKEAGWYLTNNPHDPFFYFSPAYLFHKSLVLKKGESLNLKYRVGHYTGEVTRESLSEDYSGYATDLH